MKLSESLVIFFSFVIHLELCYPKRVVPLEYYASSKRNPFHFVRNQQNRIKAEHLSKETCFDSEVNFHMGTNEPVFKMDGESPRRNVTLSSFCMDQTAVSNLQFFLYVQETKRKTEVTRLILFINYMMILIYILIRSNLI